MRILLLGLLRMQLMNAVFRVVLREVLQLLFKRICVWFLWEVIQEVLFVNQPISVVLLV